MVTSSSPERFGAYLVYELLGSGGMATVHRAERTNKDGSVTQIALKRLLPRVAMNRQLVEAFAAEARLLRYLDHSNIAQTYEHGKIVGGSYFIAMEYIRGPTLKQLVQQFRETIGGVPNEIALGIAAQICDALDHAHTRCDESDKPLSIIHRDVCPANIILAETGFVKLIDFGLAKARKTRTPDTGKGVVKGKFNYIAPEYLDGEIDARADLWATGVVLYELLTSRRLFAAPYDLETITRVRKLPIPRPSLANPRVPRELDEIVLTALQRDPARRWQSAAMMREALLGVMPGNYVDYRHVADWVRTLHAREPGARPSRSSIPTFVHQPTTTPVYPTAPRNSIVDTIARGARRLLRRQSK
jgi:serine/threonine-protein kinase